MVGNASRAEEKEKLLSWPLNVKYVADGNKSRNSILHWNIFFQKIVFASKITIVVYNAIGLLIKTEQNTIIAVDFLLISGKNFSENYCHIDT